MKIIVYDVIKRAFIIYKRRGEKEGSYISVLIKFSCVR